MGREIIKEKNREVTKSILFVCLIAVAIMYIFLGPLRLIRITSGSMEPALKTGSFHVVNRDFSFDKIRSGDIVVFIVAGGGKAAHRVVDVKNSGLVTKGDANEKPDLFLVTKENFYGKISAWKNEF